MDIGDTSPEGQLSNCAGADLVAGSARQNLTKKISVLLEKGDRAAAKAEQFYIAAGQHIKDVKGLWPDHWLEIIEQDCGLGRSRAYEILAVADGRTSVDKVRSNNAQRQRISRERRKVESVTVTDSAKPTFLPTAPVAAIEAALDAAEPPKAKAPFSLDKCAAEIRRLFKAVATDADELERLQAEDPEAFAEALEEIAESEAGAGAEAQPDTEYESDRAKCTALYLAAELDRSAEEIEEHTRAALVIYAGHGLDLAEKIIEFADLKNVTVEAKEMIHRAALAWAKLDSLVNGDGTSPDSGPAPDGETEEEPTSKAPAQAGTVSAPAEAVTENEQTAPPEDSADAGSDNPEDGDECEEEPEPKRRPVKMVPCEGVLADAIGGAVEELSELATEVREIVDGASESLQQSERIHTLENTADELERIEAPDVPDTLGEIVVTYTLPKRRYMSRASRASDAVVILQACTDILQGIPEGDARYAEAQELAGNLDEIVNTADCCEFPGMYG